jgi:Family of unknown function (DUF5309)
MAKITNAFETRDAKGNREDLSDAIYNIDPTDTPVMSTIGRRNVTNVKFDWQTENLPNADTDNAQPEGFELQRTASTPTVRRSNVVQISKRDATVTGSQEKANAAGKASEMAHQMALASKALKIDMEKITLSNQALDAGEDDGIRRTRALAHFLSTNVSRGAGGAGPVSETAAITAGTQRALTETLVKAQLQTCFDNGATPSILLTNSVNKNPIDKFEGRTNSRHNVSPDKVVSSVSVYASDFGDLKVVLDRHLPQDRVLLLDPSFARMAFYRPFQQTPLAKIGDAETRMIVAEWGVQVDNEKAHGAVFDLFDTNAEYAA